MTRTIPSRKSPHAWIVLVAALALALTADLVSKSWAFETVAGSPVGLDRVELVGQPAYSPIPPHDDIVVIPPNLLHLHLVLNSGAVFGIGSQQRALLVFFTLVALAAAIWIFGWHTDSRDRLGQVGLALILAGGIGNLIDRIVIGRVRDFLYLFPDRHLPRGWTWPDGSAEWFPWVFNLADVELLMGIGLLIITMWRTPATTKSGHAPDSNSIA